uniref:Uncharacterized protein n=1 Tax=Calidris pygmaea TaxID=425635 RepID=A0A8C3K367_9CHAR
MNNLSFSELCCLFCCPPCPGKIASKLAFLPPDPTYTLICDESGTCWTLHLSERADWQYSSREKDAIECFMTRTNKGNRIACMFVRCSLDANSFYIGLGSRINCNVFSYDYSGYGASSGKPTEKNLYADIDAAWVALRTRGSRKGIPARMPKFCCSVLVNFVSEFRLAATASGFREIKW